MREPAAGAKAERTWVVDDDLSPLFHERERLTLEESRERHAAGLATQLRELVARSAFYRRSWPAELRDAIAGADPTGAGTLLEELPLTTKDELREAQEREPPYGDYLACGSEAVARVHRTSGTTGRPLLIALSGRDAELTASYGAQAFWCAGLRPDDVVVHCLNYCMWSGGLTDHLCLEGTGAAVVPFGVGNSELLFELPRWLPATALSCTPSYVKLLIERASEEQREQWASSLRLVLVGGEPGGSNAALQRRVSEALGARLVDANYGLAEVLSMFASACPAGGGMHFHGLGALWPELIDPSTRQALQPRAGVTGELVLTHLEREAQPLVRYRTYDLLEILSLERCSCGRGGPRFLLRGRSDEMFVVRGVNVFPSAIADVLGGVSIELTEFVVTLPDAETYDTVRLQVESVRAEDGLSAAITHELKRTLGFTAQVELVAAGSLPRSEGKVPRVRREGSSNAIRS